MGSKRLPAVFPLASVALDAVAVCEGLKACLPLRPGGIRVQSVHYLDTAEDALYRDGGALLAKPQRGFWSLIRERADIGRPMGGVRAHGMPAVVAELPDGHLKAQLRSVIGDSDLQLKGTLHLSRQTLAAPGEAPRLLLETAVSEERVLGRRLLMPRQPRPDRVEELLLEGLHELSGGTPVAGHSWYPQLRPVSTVA